METTIRITESVKKRLDHLKIFQRETYNEIIDVLLEDHLELNEKTKQEIDEARARIAKGEYYTEEEVEKSLGL